MEAKDSMSKKETILPATTASDIDHDEIGTEMLGCHVAKRWGNGVVLGTVVDSGLRKKKGHFYLAWTVAYESEVVEYFDGTTGYREDLFRGELDKAMSLYEANKEKMCPCPPCKAKREKTCKFAAN